MAGFLLTNRCFSSEDKSKCLSSLHKGGETISFSSISSPHLLFSLFDVDNYFSPASHHGVTLASFGRPTFSLSQLQSAKSLPSSGGLANRLLLNTYLTQGIDELLRTINGTCVVVISDYPHLYVITDLMGYVPAFAYNPQNIDDFIISSSPELISKFANTPLDEVSLAEFLLQHKITPPYTYYEEVKYLGAASCHCWNLQDSTYLSWNYWKPFTDGFYSSIDDAVTEITSAVQLAIKERTHTGTIGTYTSGGLDSRMILFACDNPNRVKAINLYDEENREANIAQQLCSKANVQYIPFQRSKDYYPHWLTAGVLSCEGMWSAFDNHFLGTKDFLHSLGATTVMSACSADMLFKQCNLDRFVPQYFGCRPGWFKPKKFWNGGFIDPPVEHHPLHYLEAAMKSRRDSWFGFPPGRLNPLSSILIADKRSRPLVYSAGLSFFTFFTHFPYDNFIGDRRVAECYARMPTHFRLNSDVWKRVVANLCGDDIVNANTGLRPLASWREVWVNRCKSKLQPKSTSLTLHNEGSWPTFLWYMHHSPTISRLWSSITPHELEYISRILNSDSWFKPLHSWASHDDRFFFRILSTLIFIRSYF